jgi:hypothetical protein
VIAFWRLRLGWVAGWLWSFLQAVQGKTMLVCCFAEFSFALSVDQLVDSLFFYSVLLPKTAYTQQQAGCVAMCFWCLAFELSCRLVVQ